MVNPHLFSFSKNQEVHPSSVDFQLLIPCLPSDLVSGPSLLIRWVCARIQEDSRTREAMALSKKVLSQAGEGGGAC